MRVPNMNVPNMSENYNLRFINIIYKYYLVRLTIARLM